MSSNLEVSIVDSVDMDTPAPTSTVEASSTIQTPAGNKVVKPRVRRVVATANTAIEVPANLSAQATQIALHKPMVQAESNSVPKQDSKVAPITTATKLLKPKKPKLIRDSFTMPKLEHLLFEELKQRICKLGHAVKKSELIRAGIMVMAAMEDTRLVAAVTAVPTIKTGRPGNN